MARRDLKKSKRSKREEQNEVAIEKTSCGWSYRRISSAAWRKTRRKQREEKD